MTVENCILKYKKYVEVGNDAAAENMKQHILSSKKFIGHKFLQELTEVKDGKKSKRWTYCKHDYD